MITSGEGKYKIWLEQKNIGNDKIFIVGGGEKSHIGGLVVCVPNKEPKIVRIGNHYDHIVLKPIAEKACMKYNVRIAVIGGIHIDNASKDEIDKIIENCKGFLKCI